MAVALERRRSLGLRLLGFYSPLRLEEEERLGWIGEKASDTVYDDGKNALVIS